MRAFRGATGLLVGESVNSSDISSDVYHLQILRFWRLTWTLFLGLGILPLETLITVDSWGVLWLFLLLNAKMFTEVG